MGVRDPKLNFNFQLAATGAFERIRIDASMDQEVTESNALGEISIFDFSQNGLIFAGTGFDASRSIIERELSRNSYLSPYFDEAVINNRVRIRSLTSPDEDFFYAKTAPVTSLEPSELVLDDTRFAIDFSLIDALNRDIMNIFATLESFEDALGAPELLFASEYPDLADLREVYFNRLEGRIKLNEFFTLFKWFDTLLNSLIGQLLPRKTRYLGTNFVIEPHVLERPKVRYVYSDTYLEEGQRALPVNTVTSEVVFGGET